MTTVKGLHLQAQKNEREITSMRMELEQMKSVCNDLSYALELQRGANMGNATTGATAALTARAKWTAAAAAAAATEYEPRGTESLGT